MRYCGPCLDQISLGFFCSESIEVEILVNGDPILTAPYVVAVPPLCSHAIVASALNVEYDSLPTPAAHRGPNGAPVVHHVHPAGSIAGVTVMQFVTLPPRAEVAVRTSGEAPSQGFMNVRKL